MTGIQSLRKRHRWLFIGVFAFFVGGLYGLTMPPSITWANRGEDSGELAASVATLGIPHPPGYPVYILTGYLWSRLPIGDDIAYRLNWFSAVCSITAAVTLFLITDRLTRTKSLPFLAKIWGAVFLAIAPLVWSQSIITEVYTAGLCFLGLILLSGVYLFEQPTYTRCFVTGLLLGLSFGVLPQLSVLAPFIVLGCLSKSRSRSEAIRWMGRVGIGAVLGLVPFLYLPLRSAANPFFNWGSPNNWDNFWWMVSAAQYQHLAGIPTWETGIQRLAESARLLLLQIPYGGIIFIGLGIYWTARNNKRLGLCLLGIFTFSIFLKIDYFVMNNDVYLMPSIYVVCLLLGIGTASLYPIIRQRVIRLSLAACLVVLSGWEILQRLPEVNLRGDLTAVEFARQTLTTLPKDAVVFSDRDDTTFALWYALALGHRQDILIVDTRLLLYSWYRQNLAYHYPEVDRNRLRPGAVTGLENPLYRIEGQFPNFVLIPISGHSWKGHEGHEYDETLLKTSLADTRINRTIDYCNSDYGTRGYRRTTASRRTLRHLT